MTRIATLLLASASVAACAPLSQAGLVYASRGQAGVTLAAGTPETPGLELSIGMKTADFAYIPVVVGRPCEFRQAGASDCNQALIPVFGTHNARSEFAGDPPQTPPQDHPVPAPSGPKAMTHNSESQDDLPPAPPPTPEAGSDAAAERIANVLAKVLTTSNTQQDAYSVYGTFNSSGNASAPTGGGSGSTGLTLGRVFSTGVAAQNLSDGQRVSALNQCMAQAVASAGQDAALKQQLLSACAAAAGRP